ncbi:hypothetical protein [Streptomyces sp. NL15-2K]|uniref:hypothetical protein n=1 Tax=Streptomyces sp. NL15-2K TaxID=376149 RepID=UPI000F5773AF|nr:MULTISPECIES: hypothetical protein [Actinomycetes]WKX15747.1 hypothetical protein Q4V64_52925 [Kutzneria buriramensis]
MTRTSSEIDHLPIYEDLVQERGDAVAEAQMAAQHTQHQAAELLGGQHAHQPHRPTDSGGGSTEWNGRS